MIRRKRDTDGRCCHHKRLANVNICDAMEQEHMMLDICDTYQCPFYKPAGCSDWVRLDSKTLVNMLTPEEYRK